MKLNYSRKSRAAHVENKVTSLAEFEGKASASAQAYNMTPRVLFVSALYYWRTSGSVPAENGSKPQVCDKKSWQSYAAK